MQENAVTANAEVAVTEEGDGPRCQPEPEPAAPEHKVVVAQAVTLEEKISPYGANHKRIAEATERYNRVVSKSVLVETNSSGW